LVLSCKNDSKPILENETTVNSEGIQVAIPQDSIAYFENALTYQYEQNGAKEELWFYVNEQKKEILYVPNDDMIQAVISYPDGTFKIFATNEKGEKIVYYNPEHHIFINDAKKIKKDAELGDEIVFPLEEKSDYGRIAAQTAKQVIVQKIREAERVSVFDEYGEKEGSIITGTVQRFERGN
jgi:hypothetical protein